MKTVTIRKKLHSFIDIIPDNCLSSVEPLLSFLADETGIENNLTDEEKKWVTDGRKHHEKHPEDFIQLV